MRKVFTAVLAVVCVLAFTACRNYETYGDKKKKERSAISRVTSPTPAATNMST